MIAGHSDMWKSFVRFCNDFTRDLQMNNISKDVQFWNYDDKGGVDDLPTTDLVGLGGFTYTLGTPIVRLEVAFGVSMLDDTNMFRHHDVLDFLVPKVAPGEELPLLDTVTGQQKGHMMSLNGAQLLPVGRTEVRPLQFLATQWVLSARPLTPDELDSLS